MKTEQVVYWIIQREAAKVQKESGGTFPYSADPIIATTRFTNVRREDDKVTRYLASSWWRKEFRPTSPQELVLARMVNNIPALDEILSAGIENAYEVLWERADRGEKVWGSAYTISTCGRAMDKIDYVINHVVDAVPEWDYGIKTLAEAHKWFMRVDGLGSFLAAQIVADIKNIPHGPLSRAPDWMTWSAPGPGSLKGLSWFYGVRITPSTYEQAITTAWAAIMPLLPLHLQNLHMQDVQNVFCEVSKYARLLEGRGHARNKYRG